MGTLVLKRFLAMLLIGLLAGMPAGPTAWAQAPTAGEGPPPASLSAQQLEELVGRIALYPDDLVAIILPAATFPLDVVQADRFLQKLKQDKNLKPDERWDESIRNLLNYPEVVGMMSQDLDWTQDLGEAVVGQQADVLKAIQAFRAKAASAGNLKTDDKQIIVQEKESIQIVPADPEVIYVPQYQPSTVVVSQPVYVPPAYYPMPYPSYYYPYPPGYAFAGFAAGAFFGASVAWACNWGGGHVENNVNISNTSNMNVNRNDPQRQQKADQAKQRAQERGQQGGAQARQQGQGGRGQGGASQWQSQKRPGDVSQGRVSAGSREARPGYGSGGGSRGDSFGNPGRGSAASMDSSRGAQSRGPSAGTMDRGSGSRGASAGSMDRGGGGSRGQSASTMDRGGSGSRGGGASAGSASRGGGGASAGAASRGGGGGGASRGGGGGGGGGSRGGGGGGGRR